MVPGFHARMGFGGAIKGENAVDDRLEPAALHIWPYGPRDLIRARGRKWLARQIQRARFPHIVNGGGYSTQLILLGPSVSGKLSFQ